jgi:TonB family protein
VKFLVTLLVASSVAVLESAQQQTSNLATDIDAITVDRKGCFGGCPRYKLTLRRQGISTYIGKTGLRRGLYTAPVMSVGDFERLTQAISEIRFFDLPDVIGPGVEDAEQVVVTVTTTQKSKTVTTYDLHDRATVPFAAFVTLADGVAAKLPWENLNQPKDGIIGPFLLRGVEPQYTEEARRARMQGPVIVLVEVKPDGTVAPDNITIVQGLGMGLDEKAIQAVRQWIFKPAYRDGKPMGITMPVAVQVEFRL